MQEAATVKFKGAMTAVLFKDDGTVETHYKDNIIVNTGFDFIANAIGLTASRPEAMNAIALGTDTTAATLAQTALAGELAREAATYAHTAGTKVFSFAANFAAGVATGAITEAGVFNSIVANSGIMFDRVVFPVINKGAADTLQVTFTFTVS
jgi:hypothetical protein